MVSRRKTFPQFLLGILLPVGLVCVGAIVSPRPAASATGLTGVVKSTEGNALEGVAVSARNLAESFTTTVYTDENGQFVFPSLTAGKYTVWAQAVGFQRFTRQVQMDGTMATVLKFALPALADFLPQLSGTEWAASLAEETPLDRRMRTVFINNCSGCHEVSFPLQNRFDEAGWRAVVTLMQTMQSIGYVPEGQATDQVIQAYRPELAEYLARVRGPATTSMTAKPLPRVKGEAARIVVTEYDLSRPGQPDWVMKHNGSNWSEGTPSRYDGRAAHDVAIDPGGFVWFADDATPDRTLGKLDPRTGKVTDYKLADATNHAEVSHALVFDRQGNIWFSNGTEGAPTKFDPETGKFFRFPRPNGFPFSGDFITLDGKGNVWSPHKQGAFKLDPATGKYTNYSDGPPKANYDLAADKEDHIWVSQPGGNSMAYVDPDLGKVERVMLDPATAKDFEISDEDRDISSKLRLTANTATPLEKGPRRSATDRERDIVWVCEFFGDRLAKIDPRTKKVTEYPLPHRFSQPYSATVDKNHRVWITMLNSDRIARFDPDTETFTEFELPTRGTEIRHIQVDNSTNPPTVWLPYDRTNKIARVQFRGAVQ